ncbi:hypothetical protein MKW92_000735, partial [Papaver armeniacum]
MVLLYLIPKILVEIDVYVTFEDKGGAQSKGIGIKLMDRSLSNWIKLEFLPSVSFDYRSCLLIRQSLYLGDARNFVSVGGGITEVRRFHSSFHTTQSGLTLTK